MKSGVLEMKNKDNQSTLYRFFKPTSTNASTGGENNAPSGSVPGVPRIMRPDSPKPTRILEDLDAALQSSSIELPSMKTVPSVYDALSVQDNMKLWTILGFLEDHAKGYIGSDIVLPDLDGFRFMVLACKEKFKELLEIYEVLYTGVRKSQGKKEHIDAFVIPEVLSRYFMGEGEEKWANMLANTEFVDLHPHSHIDMMNLLLDSIIDTASFREHVSGLDDIMAQLKAERDKKVALKESSLVAIREFDAKLATISEELKELNKVDGVVDLDDEEFIVRSRSKRKKDAEEESKRMESLKSLTGKKDILESKKRQSLQRVAEVDEFLKNERPDKEVADLRLRGKASRFSGYDRNGRLYWRVPISSSEKLEGLLVESVIYFVHENDTDSVQIVEDIPAIKKPEPPKKKKRKNEDYTSEISSYSPSDGEDAVTVDDSSDVVLTPDVCSVRLELKSIFEYINSQATLLDLQNSLNINGVREYPLKKALQRFIGENQDSLFSDDKDTFLNAFLDWILSRNESKRITDLCGNTYLESALHLIHQILPYIIVGLNLKVDEILPTDLKECISLCEGFKDTPFYRNKQLYKELTTIKTYSAMIHWLQRAESYTAYLIQKEEIKTMREEQKVARQLASVSSSSQTVSQRSTDTVSTETSRSKSRRSHQSSKGGSSSRQKNKKSDKSRFRRSGRNTNRKDYTIKLVITSSESSESESDSEDKRRSQRVRLKKMRDIESSGSENDDSSEDDLVVRIDITNAKSFKGRGKY